MVASNVAVPSSIDMERSFAENALILYFGAIFSMGDGQHFPIMNNTAEQLVYSSFSTFSASSKSLRIFSCLFSYEM